MMTISKLRRQNFKPKTESIAEKTPFQTQKSAAGENFDFQT
jgi:hypothetical protein